MKSMEQKFVRKIFIGSEPLTLHGGEDIEEIIRKQQAVVEYRGNPDDVYVNGEKMTLSP